MRGLLSCVQPSRGMSVRERYGEEDGEDDEGTHFGLNEENKMRMENCKERGG